MSTQSVFGYTYFNKNTDKYEEVLVQVMQDGKNKLSYAYALAMLKTKVSESKDLFKELIDCAEEEGGWFEQFGAINTYTPNQSLFGNFKPDIYYRRGVKKSIFDENENMFIVKYNKDTDDIESIYIKEEHFIDTKTPHEFQEQNHSIQSLEEMLNKESGSETILPLTNAFQSLINSGKITTEFAKAFNSSLTEYPFQRRPYGTPRGTLQVTSTSNDSASDIVLTFNSQHTISNATSKLG